LRRTPISGHIVEDDLERPRRGQAHHHLHQRCGQDDGERAAAGSEQFAKQRWHVSILLVIDTVGEP